MKMFQNHPQYHYLKEKVGIIIFSDPNAFLKVVYEMIILVIFLVTSSTLIRYIIYHEIKLQLDRMSVQTTKYHEKIGKDSAFQVITNTFCLGIYPLWAYLTKYIDPGYDSTSR
ncbi:unnamed protein product [Caenorhabditis angaria]|uniref:Uncharacterized protein n=1 Tax=Caenorhabditis angaria TaxID=860376 RepID=A0A9P1IM85_9PELO|nr:unnamed protein product [Caenorhabditis angaria]